MPQFYGLELRRGHGLYCAVLPDWRYPREENLHIRTGFGIRWDIDALPELRRHRKRRAKRQRSVARHEHHVAKLDNSASFVDLFRPGILIAEQKSAGRDLYKDYGQAGECFDALPEHGSPRHILVSDFQTFELHDSRPLGRPYGVIPKAPQENRRDHSLSVASSLPARDAGIPSTPTP